MLEVMVMPSLFILIFFNCSVHLWIKCSVGVINLAVPILQLFPNIMNIELQMVVPRKVWSQVHCPVFLVWLDLQYARMLSV
jgi:hypothetical protein